MEKFDEGSDWDCYVSLRKKHDGYLLRMESWNARVMEQRNRS
jgi:hypothetical protein